MPHTVDRACQGQCDGDDQPGPDGNGTRGRTEKDGRAGPGAVRRRARSTRCGVDPGLGNLGYIAAISGATEPSQISDSVIAQVAADYDISETAVLAALLYYAEHRGAIDAFLEANAAASRP